MGVEKLIKLWYEREKEREREREREREMKRDGEVPERDTWTLNWNGGPYQSGQSLAMAMQVIEI